MKGENKKIILRLTPKEALAVWVMTLNWKSPYWRKQLVTNVLRYKAFALLDTKTRKKLRAKYEVNNL